MSKFNEGDWVCDGHRVARVKNVWPQTSWCPEETLDLVLYSRGGEKIGRESDPMGGPRGYEPCCGADNWRLLQGEPDWPLPRYGELTGEKEDGRMVPRLRFVDTEPDQASLQHPAPGEGRLQ